MLALVFVGIIILLLCTFIAAGHPCPKCGTRRTRELSRSGKIIEVGCDKCHCVFPVETH